MLSNINTVYSHPYDEEVCDGCQQTTFLGPAGNPFPRTGADFQRPADYVLDNAGGQVYKPSPPKNID